MRYKAQKCLPDMDTEVVTNILKASETFNKYFIKMHHLDKKNTIKDSQINQRSWSLSEGRQHSNSGNARWEETLSRGMTKASGNEQ